MVSIRRRLIVNADDFGRSHAINQAVIRAHEEGILTTASLMVNGEACAEAVQLAKQHPRLGVGLHLTLVCGRATLPASRIPGLVSAQGQEFSHSPVGVGMNYFFRSSLRPQLEEEMAAQFRLFGETGLPMDHVNGHLNLHLHPVVFGVLMRQSQAWNIQRLRLTYDPLGLNLRLASGRWLYRFSHALIFRLLSRRAAPSLARRKIRSTSRVFGLLQNSCVHEAYIAGLLPQLPAGDSELYSHPCLEKFKDEFDALVSPRVRAIIQDERIELIRYQDL